MCCICSILCQILSCLLSIFCIALLVLLILWVIGWFMQYPTAMAYPTDTLMDTPAPAGPAFSYPTMHHCKPVDPMIEWIPVTLRNAASLSGRAVVAGYEGDNASPLWVIRAQYEGDLIPGKYAPHRNAAYVPRDGKENSVNQFEVLCARPGRFCWANPNIIVILKAILAGNIKDGEPLYIGGAKEEGSLSPGKESTKAKL